MSLMTLANETIVDILSWLDLNSLLQCRSTCSLLRNTIDGSMALRLIISLGTAGYLYNPNTGLSTIAYSEALNHLQHNWDTPKPTAKVLGLLPRQLSRFPTALAISGYFMAFRTLAAGLTTIDLRNSHHIAQARLHSDMRISWIANLLIDPDQDLLILSTFEMDSSDRETLSLHFRKLSEPEVDHPKAHRPVLRRAMPDSTAHGMPVPLTECEIIMHINSGIIALLVFWANREEESFITADWLGGSTILWSDDQSKSTLGRVLDFHLLDEIHVLLLRFDLSNDTMPTPVIELVTCSSLPSLTPLAIFELPSLSPAIEPSRWINNSERTTPAANSSVLFRPTPNKFLSLTIVGGHVRGADEPEFSTVSCDFVIPTALFRQHQANTLTKLVPWREWGLHHSRCIPHDVTFDSHEWYPRKSISQSRYVETGFRDGNRYVRVLDFNPFRISSQSSNPAIMVGPSQTSSHGLFAGEIQTSLPYHAVEFPLNAFAQSDHLVLVEAERIISTMLNSQGRVVALTIHDMSSEDIGSEEIHRS